MVVGSYMYEFRMVYPNTDAYSLSLFPDPSINRLLPRTETLTLSF